MRIRKKISLPTLAAILDLVAAIPQPTWAGAWTQPKGQSYTKLSSLFYRSDEIFNADGSPPYVAQICLSRFLA